MRLPSIVLAAVGVVLVVSMLSIWFYPSKHDFMASNPKWNGMKDFSREFGASDINSLEDLSNVPKESVLVLIPRVKPEDQELSRLSEFVHGGGTLLLTDDYGQGNDVLSYLGVMVRFSRYPLLDPLFCYKNKWLPLVTDFSPEVRADGVSSVVLNHATALTGVEMSEAIAWSSSSSFLDVDGSDSRTVDDPIGPFSVAASIRFGGGTVVVVSDPSIMINSMLVQQDNNRFLRYLSSRDGKQLNVLIARSEVAVAPLDVSRVRLAGLRDAMRSPYALLGLLVLIFVAVSRYTLWKGKPVG